jgi:hypothetical protein
MTSFGGQHPSEKTKNKSLSLERVEWDFDKVTEAEVKKCCIYEYARESDYIRTAYSRYGEALKWLPKSYPTPWQCLPLDEKQKFLPAPLQQNPFSRLSWTEASALLSPIPTLPKNVSFVETNPPKVDLSQILGTENAILPSGQEIGLFCIDWSNCSDKKLKTSFMEFIEANRPKGIGKKHERGRPPWKGGLDHLAMMRLLHHYTFDEITRLVPLDWGNQSKYSENSEALKEKMQADELFRKLFPWLPKAERPRSWSSRCDAGNDNKPG